jgi:hypothetical protein
VQGCCWWRRSGGGDNAERALGYRAYRDKEDGQSGLTKSYMYPV